MSALRRSSSLDDHAAAAGLPPVTATMSMMIVVVLPLPRRPAVMKKHGLSGSNERSIKGERGGNDCRLADMVGGDIDQPLVTQELHRRLHSLRGAVLALRDNRP